MEARCSDHAEQPTQTRNARRRLGRNNTTGQLEAALARVRQLEARLATVTSSSSSDSDGAPSIESSRTIFRGTAERAERFHQS